MMALNFSLKERWQPFVSRNKNAYKKRTETEYSVRFFAGFILFIKNAGDRGRTGTKYYLRGILSPVRLPIPPLRQKAYYRIIGGDT